MPVFFIRMGEQIESLRHWRIAGPQINDTERQTWIENFTAWRDACRMFDLDAAEQEAERALAHLTSTFTMQGHDDQLFQEEVERSQLKRYAEDFHRVFLYQLRARVFFSVDVGKEHLVRDDNLFGDEVARQFPKAVYEIKEASRCLAFNRFTAAAFHCMRILELGLDALAKQVGVPVGNTNWQPIIDQIEKSINAMNISHGTNWKQEQQFYREAAVQFRHFKDAWRNHVMHIHHTYDAEKSEEIYRSVRSFMQHIATRLHE